MKMLSHAGQTTAKVTFLGAAMAAWLAPAAAAAEAKSDRRDYLGVVKAYADTLIKHGRDTYGKVQSPLFAAALDRKTLTIEGVKSPASVRPEDSSVGSANPMHDQNLYQILYALTEISGEKKYAAEADKALKYLFENCQHPTSGLMAWGEHMSWDLTKDAIKSQGYADPYHEYTRPWVLWERCFELAPGPCARFAKGVWQHQIHDRDPVVEATGRYTQQRHLTQVSHKKHGAGKCRGTIIDLSCASQANTVTGHIIRVHAHPAT